MWPQTIAVQHYLQQCYVNYGRLCSFALVCVHVLQIHMYVLSILELGTNRSMQRSAIGLMRWTHASAESHANVHAASQMTCVSC
jgi:hypothetical protein